MTIIGQRVAGTCAPSLVDGLIVENKPERVLQNDLPLNWVSSWILGNAVVLLFSLVEHVSVVDMLARLCLMDGFFWHAFAMPLCNVTLLAWRI